ncbi:MAG TPA: hemerythrin [Bacteroidetes bacterium]|jgi:hemerythrin|nr:hemerythrin [Bacteroidota bacterium]
MATLVWKDVYSVGVEDLDQQHKRLLDLVNELTTMDRKKIDNKAIFTALNELVAYAQTHFDTEEGYMTRFEFPHLAAHQREHVAFAAKVFNFAQRLEQNDPHLHATVVDFLKTWYTSHVLGTDREYIEYLVPKQAK